MMILVNPKDYEIATGDRDMNGQLLKSFKRTVKTMGIIILIGLI